MAVKVQAKDGSDNVYFANWDRDWTLIGRSSSSVLFSTSNWNELYINVAPYYTSSGQIMFYQEGCDFYIPTLLIDDTSQSYGKDYTTGYGSGHTSNTNDVIPGIEVTIRITTGGVYLISYYTYRNTLNNSTSVPAYLRVYGR